MHLLPCLLLLFLPYSTWAGERKVLLISMDGFVHDLLTKKNVPNIHKFASERSSWFVNGVQSQMLTVTASNHMSIVSGLCESDHGIVGNYFWDRKKQAMYDKFNIAGGADIREASEKSEWNPIDPIWLLNQRNGGKSTVINWPAGDYERSEASGVKMTRYRAGFGDNSQWLKEITMVHEALETNNLVLWYIAEPDSTLHGHGFHDGKLEAKLKELDKLFDSLIHIMGSKGQLRDTDIILTADHGHIQVRPNATLCVNRILGDELVNDEDYRAGDSNIYHTNRTRVFEMYEMLRKAIAADSLPYRVYLKENVPDDWHYVNADRTGDIVIEPLFGGQVKMRCKSDHDDSATSTHGQDPRLPEMRALLVLSGPSFQNGSQIEDIPENIDLFPLMLRLLKINPEPRHNGELSRLEVAFSSEGIREMNETKKTEKDSSGGIFLMSSSCIAVVLAMMLKA